MESSFDYELITPQIRNDIGSGAYSREMIALLPEALVRGDRVLVIGAGLGILATLVAKSGLADRIIAIEANAQLIPHIERVKALNGADQVEVVHGVPGHGRRGMVPFFIGRDFRFSSLTPMDGRWRAAMKVPFLDLNLILAEEQISLIICDVPEIASRLLAKADLSLVDRIMVRFAPDDPCCWREPGLCAGLAVRGYATPPRTRSRPATLFRRIEAAKAARTCACGAANAHSPHCAGAADVVTMMNVREAGQNYPVDEPGQDISLPT